MKKAKSSRTANSAKTNKKVRPESTLNESHATLASDVLVDVYSKFAAALEEHLPGFKVSSFNLKPESEATIPQGCHLGPDGKTIICR